MVRYMLSICTTHVLKGIIPKAIIGKCNNYFFLYNESPFAIFFFFCCFARKGKNLVMYASAAGQCSAYSDSSCSRNKSLSLTVYFSLVLAASQEPECSSASSHLHSGTRDEDTVLIWVMSVS